MSLRALLTGKDFWELRDKLKSEFLRPEFRLKNGIGASPLTDNPALAGKAFEYLMGFHLHHRNGAVMDEDDICVPEYTYDLLVEGLGKNINSWLKSRLNAQHIYVETLRSVNIQFGQTRENHTRFVADGQLTDGLVASAIFLAKLDRYFWMRTIDREFHDYIHNHNPDDIRDLRAMSSLLDNADFVAKHRCMIQPAFGYGSCRGSADLIIDDTLIDIKTNRHSTLERRDLDQVLCYYLLSLTGGIDGNPDEKPIKNIGIYYARYGELWTVPVSRFGDESKWDSFKDWFCDYLLRKKKELNDSAADTHCKRMTKTTNSNADKLGQTRKRQRLTHEPN